MPLEALAKIFRCRRRLARNFGVALPWLIFHIVTTAMIPCDDYNLNSPVDLDYDKKEAEAYASTLADIICAKARVSQILSDVAMEQTMRRH